MSQAIRVLFWLAAIALIGHASAQTWPAKPVKFIVPNAAGSVPDVIARMLGDRLSLALGRQFVVENNTAGAGLVAAQVAGRSAPDGYTFFLGTIVSLATNQYMFKSLPYDPERDFTPVAMLYDSGAFAIAVHPDVAAGSLSELIALAKAQPGKLSYAADRGLASIVGEWLNKVVGTQIVLVPYKAVAQSLQDTVAGRTQMIIISTAAVDSLRRAGKLRVLAVSSINRFPGLKDIPTISETVPGFHAAGWSSLVAPTGTPAEILQRLNRETDRFLKEPEVIERLLGFGLTTSGAGTPQSVAEFVRNERERWGRIMKEVGVQPE